LRKIEARVTALAQPRFAHRQPLLIAGLRRRFSTDALHDIAQLWREFGQQRASIPGAAGKSAYGIVIHGAHAAGSIEYLAGQEVNGLARVPDEFDSMRIPAHQYAIFPHRGHVAALRHTMAAIWNDWLPTSGRVAAHPDADSPNMIEYYGEDFDPESGLGTIEVWLPIKA
jgi:AraC family transcriptional regulator